jgi:hypothetical protein
MAEMQNQPSWISRAVGRLYRELGLASIISAPRDVGFLFASRFIRMFAYGSGSLIIALYFSALGISDSKIGLFMTLTLFGDAFISLPLAFCADALGRRKMLMLGAVMMVGAGLVFAQTGNYWLLLIAAILGVISPRLVFGVTLEILVNQQILSVVLVAMKLDHFELSKRLRSLNWRHPKYVQISSPGICPNETRRWFSIDSHQVYRCWHHRHSLRVSSLRLVRAVLDLSPWLGRRRRLSDRVFGLLMCWSREAVSRFVS